VSMLAVHSLWPVPERALCHAMKGMRRIVVAELNLGQYLQEIERVAFSIDPRPEVVGVNRVDGELITPQEIGEQLL
jgi:2-oxoglutarate/2-oxoacid ferredoxin oxidoreductase subunit alpha